MFGIEKPEITDYLCPFSGEPLWNFGGDFDTLDGPTTYATKDKKFVYEIWPREVGFRLHAKIEDGILYESKFPFEHLIFVLDETKFREDKTSKDVWIETYRVYDELLRIDDPLFFKKALEGRRRYQERQLDDSLRYKDNDLPHRRFYSTLMKIDTIVPMPLPMPQGQIFYLDYKYNFDEDKKKLSKWIWNKQYRYKDYHKIVEYRLFGILVLKIKTLNKR